MPGIICKFTNSSSEKGSRQLFYWSEQHGKEFFSWKTVYHFVTLTTLWIHVLCLIISDIWSERLREKQTGEQRRPVWHSTSGWKLHEMWVELLWQSKCITTTVTNFNHSPLILNTQQWLAVDYVNSRFNIIDFELERTTGKTLRVGTTHSFHWYFDSLPSLWLLHLTINETISKVIFNSRIWSW